MLKRLIKLDKPTAAADTELMFIYSRLVLLTDNKQIKMPAVTVTYFVTGQKSGLYN